MMTSKRTSLTALLGALLACGNVAVSAQTAAPPPAQSESSSGAQSSGAPGSGAAKSGAGTTTVTVPMVVLVPVEVQTDPKLNNGCWVSLADKDAMPKKGNDILTIVGRMYMPSFETPSGVNWSRKADSLTVGPNARVTVYSDREYKGSSAKLTGGQQVKDISKELGFVQSIDSMQVDCTA